MAVRKFIVVAGQDNATEVANAIEWEEKHLYASLRNPTNLPSQSPDFAGGAYSDILTLPFTFKGGPQAADDGATTFGSHQTANLMGKATRAVKYLTFYDPTASYQNSGTATTSTYPGTGTILAGSTPTSLTTSVTWKYSPSGVVITRRRTGTTHTINSSATTNVITFAAAQALVPPPEAGELFDYTPTAGAAGSETTIKFESQFGGNSDPGSASDPTLSAAINASGEHACYINTILTSGSYGSSPVGGPARITCTSRPVYIGQPIQFTNGTSHSVPSGLSASTTYYVTRKAEVRETVTSSAYDAGNNQIDFASAHGLGDNEPVKIAVATGNFPSELNDTTKYYVKIFDHQTIQLRTAINGSAIAFGESASGTITVTRLDSHAAFFVATVPGGDEIAITANTSALQHATAKQQNIQILFEPVFRGSLTGLQARCVSTVGDASNVGIARALHDVQSNGTVTTDAWPLATADGDTFAIEVPPLNNQTIPFEKWAMWLPWSPFEGNASYDGPSIVKITSAASANVEVTLETTPALSGGAPVVGTAVKFFSNGDLPDPLIAGQVYYIHSITTNVNTGVSTVTLKDAASDTGAVIGVSGGTASQSSIGGLDSTTDVAVTGASASHVMFVYDQEGKQNPYPPGFNYPNHHATPRPYQAFDGPGEIAIKPQIGFHSGLALKMHEYTGETMHVAVCAVTDTSIGHKEIYPLTATPTSHSWLDAGQHKSWSAGESNNCFARLEDVLDAAKLAFEADGDTGECVGVFWLQGEEDAKHEQLANNYENSCRKLRSSVRKAIKDRALTTSDEENIPFIHPKITTASNRNYNATVNTAIEALAEEDPYTRTFEVSTFALDDGLSIPIHYSGVGMTSMETSAYDAWRDVQRSGSSEVDVCNLALANIGDKADVTSINPSDGSHQADLCARYYPLARDLLLERHRWDFTIRQTALIALTNTRTEWDYAYRLPSDFSGAIAILAKDSTDDQVVEGVPLPQPFAIEADKNFDLVMYTDMEDAQLRYTAKTTDSSKFSQSFIHALSWRLASMLAGALIKGDAGAQAVQNATQMAEFYASRAAAHDSRTTRDKPVVDANITPWDR